MDFTSETGTKVALALRSIAAWLVALILFFPILFMLVTSFKTELQAIAVPSIWIFTPTLDNYTHVQERSDYLLYAKNSLVTSVVSTLLGLLIAAPAAYSMAFFPSKRTQADPHVDAVHQDDAGGGRAGARVRPSRRACTCWTPPSRWCVIFMLGNLPLMVWMLYSHFKDIPPEILEAARMDGASLLTEFRHVILPLAMGGIASTGLLCLVLAWNEAFWSLNLTAANAGTLAALIASYSSPEGLFWSKLSAASVLAIAPIVVFGWFSQKQLVQGLTFGAVK